MARWHLWAGLLVMTACKRTAPATPPGACDSAAACVALAEAELRAPSPSSGATVIAALGRACDLRSGEACLRLSHFLALHGAERGPVNALLDRACEAGHHGACLTVAEALLEGRRGRLRDVPRGLALLEKACRAGESAACGQLAELRPDAGPETPGRSPEKRARAPRSGQR
jgi:hypothetical protein